MASVVILIINGGFIMKTLFNVVKVFVAGFVAVQLGGCIAAPLVAAAAGFGGISYDCTKNEDNYKKGAYSKAVYVGNYVEYQCGLLGYDDLTVKSTQNSKISKK